MRWFSELNLQAISEDIENQPMVRYCNDQKWYRAIKAITLCNQSFISVTFGLLAQVFMLQDLAFNMRLRNDEVCRVQIFSMIVSGWNIFQNGRHTMLI